MTAERPAGVTVVAAAFLLAAAYLFGIGLFKLVKPDLVSFTAGADLLGGLRLAGPPVFLFAAALGMVIALGLWRLQKWARWLAILAAIFGVLLLVPAISGAVVFFRIGKLIWGAVDTIVRVIIVQYLFQPDVKEAFQRS